MTTLQIIPDLNCDMQENISSPNNINLHPQEDNQNIESLDTSTSMLQDVRSRGKRRIVDCQTKRLIYDILLHDSCEGKIERGVFTRVARSFMVSPKSVSRIWQEGNYVRSTSGIAPTFSSRYVQNAGRKRSIELSLDKMKEIPLRRRTNIRSLAKALEMSRSTVHRRIKEGCVRPHSNAVKPSLTEENKKARLEFCLSMINKDVVASNPSFINMHDYIHIDEKWFYMSKATQKFYLHREETDPLRTCKSKRFISKVMFMAAVARPRFDTSSNTYFNGKIGIWPFVSYEPAQRNSKNRVAGTVEIKPILSVNKQVIRGCFLERLLPAIREKWPSSNDRTIYIQQDNAKPHLRVDDPEFAAAAKQDGFDIRLCS